MNFAHLKTFVAVARTGSFTAAAADLHLTQPCISFHIKALESDLGLRLFVRVGRRIEMTEGARVVLPYAEAIFNVSERLNREIQSRSTHRSGTIYLGSGVFFAEHYLPEILAAFRKQCPEIDIRCETMQTRALIRKVLSFDYDFAFLGDVESEPQLEVVELASDEIIVIVAPDHPLSGRIAIPVDELGNWPLIGYPDGSETQAVVEDLFKAQRLKPATALVFASSEGLKRAVEAGVGIALIPRKPAARELAAGSLRGLKIRGTPLRRRYTLVSHRDNPLSPAASAFRNVVLKWKARHKA
jgi:LysR family transcriptional regulator, transcriptional activator of the cysJI operon